MTVNGISQTTKTSKEAQERIKTTGEIKIDRKEEREKDIQIDRQIERKTDRQLDRKNERNE